MCFIGECNDTTISSHFEPDCRRYRAAYPDGDNVPESIIETTCRPPLAFQMHLPYTLLCILSHSAPHSLRFRQVMVADIKLAFHQIPPATFTKLISGARKPCPRHSFSVSEFATTLQTPAAYHKR